jgi:hypothetical protein
MEFLVVLLIVTAYMLPALVAALRGHPQVWAITALDLILGWSVLGWVAALVWSLTAIPKGQRI